MRKFVFVALMFGSLSCEQLDSNEQRVSYQAIHGINKVDLTSTRLKLDSMLFASGRQVYTLEGVFQLNDSIENYRLTFDQNPLSFNAGVSRFLFDSKDLMEQLDTCFMSVNKNGVIELTWKGENGRLFISDQISAAY